MLVSYQDTEKLMVSQRQRRSIYTTTSCCKTRTSIIVTKSIVLLVGVAVLLVGAVVAGSIVHQPMDCDDMNSSNSSSLEWESSTLTVPLNPTRTREATYAFYLMITPSPTLAHESSPFMIPMISPTPSF